MRTVFMGSPEIAVPSLQRLARETELALVVSQPDRPAGRGRRLRPPPVAVAAGELGIPVWQPESLRGAENDPRLAGIDVIVVMAYGALLRRGVLALPRRDCINLHASLLPRWRGASPLQAAIRAGDRETGVSVMRMVPALDAGPVYLRRAFALPDDATLPWLHDRMAGEAAEALGDFLALGADAEPTPQDETRVTWCGKLTPADGELDPRRPARELERQVRAYTPVPGCWLASDAGRLRVQAARVGPATGTAPGTTTVVDGRPVVACKGDSLILDRVQSPGGRPLDGADWVRGHAVPERLGPAAL